MGRADITQGTKMLCEAQRLPISRASPQTLQNESLDFINGLLEGPRQQGVRASLVLLCFRGQKA